jgi:hypothetical protein
LFVNVFAQDEKMEKFAMWLADKGLTFEQCDLGLNEHGTLVAVEDILSR